MLKDFRAVIAAEIEAGRSLEQIKAGDATAEIDAIWDGKHFPTALFREIVYSTLAGGSESAKF